MRLETLIWFGGLLARGLYGYEEHGVHNIPSEGPCILGCNHAGKLLSDMFAILAIMQRRKPMIVAPEGMYRGRPARAAGRSAGEVAAIKLLQMGVARSPTVGIRRGGDSPASQNLAILKALEEGAAVFLAVEGEVSWDGRIKPARSGAPWLALRSGAPFVPCGITGSYDVWPRWETSPKLTGKITVRIGEPLHLSDGNAGYISSQKLADAGDQIMSAIGALVGPLQPGIV
jgi:1-acyl-sn-glycerol-3-phosphate acyltransferase